MTQLTFRIVGGTGAQRKVVRALLRDISAVTGRRYIARAHGPHCRRIVFGDGLFLATESEMLAYYLSPTPRSHVLALRPGLTGIRLYYTLAHEFGHFLGLGHEPTGLMAPRDSAHRYRVGLEFPTPRQRLRIMRQLGISLVLHNTLFLVDAPA